MRALYLIIALLTLAAAAGCQYAECGNGIVEGLEQCDDGNFDNDDECLRDCTLPSCGDGYVSSTEECDAGPGRNVGAYGGCLPDCTLGPRCGDGVLERGIEACDTGPLNADSAACTSRCALATCGDGLVFAGVEVCDDGYTDACGTCNVDCTGPGTGATCGDGQACAEIEECDDGNLVAGDDCLDTCVWARCGDGFVQEGVEVCDDGCFVFQQLSMFGDTACGLRYNGRIHCWGQDNYGLLTSPRGSFKDIAVGATHACALSHDGTPLCWGAQDAGAWAISLLLPPPGSFTQLAAGEFGTCGLDDHGNAYCWGSAGNQSLSPQPGPFVRLALGSDHGCGLRPQGTVACWGANAAGQAQPPESRFLQIAAGPQITCGVRADRRVVCWGDPAVAAFVPADETALSIDVGAGFVCAVRTEAAGGGVHCFGAGAAGGDVQSLHSGPVGEPAPRMVQVAAGRTHACGLDTQGLPVCWSGEAGGRLREAPRATCGADCLSAVDIAGGQQATGANVCFFCPPGDEGCSVAAAAPGDTITVWSCDTRPLDGQCTEYTGSAWLASNIPCGDWGNLVASSCPEGALLGSCVLDPLDANGFRRRHYDYPSSTSASLDDEAAAARAACRAMGGVFEPR